MNGLCIKEESRYDILNQLTEEEMRIGLSTDKCEFCDNDYHQQMVAYITRFHSPIELTTIKIPVKFCPACGRQLY